MEVGGVPTQTAGDAEGLWERLGEGLASVLKAKVAPLSGYIAPSEVTTYSGARHRAMAAIVCPV